MAKRIPKTASAKSGGGVRCLPDIDAGNGAQNAKVCDVCGRATDELKAGRCPKCFAKVIKELHSARGIRGF